MDKVMSECGSEDKERLMHLTRGHKHRDMTKGLERPMGNK